MEDVLVESKYWRMWSEKLNGIILPWQRGLGSLTCAWRCVGGGGGGLRLLEEEWTSERAREGGGTMGWMEGEAVEKVDGAVARDVISVVLGRWW